MAGSGFVQKSSCKRAFRRKLPPAASPSLLQTWSCLSSTLIGIASSFRKYFFFLRGILTASVRAPH